MIFPVEGATSLPCQMCDISDIGIEYTVIRIKNKRIYRLRIIIKEKNTLKIMF